MDKKNKEVRVINPNGEVFIKIQNLANLEKTMELFDETQNDLQKEMFERQLSCIEKVITDSINFIVDNDRKYNWLAMGDLKEAYLRVFKQVDELLNRAEHVCAEGRRQQIRDTHQKIMHITLSKLLKIEDND